ncbi:Gfo/Idh/MocA family protein [Neobacillus vireti]|uniref:Oxidoreductase domain-containing protein n=1 Tax=Neobacillus vireti LMG 21834 TaxID=1131730 RepID=A0AB94IU64_9BACI|nr:Gfo/Idh/MocA family oxidoreductase [Neobacillus vireti]ETI70602.1 oxidoreductase domain-containing protein [Neobacillus vireti LMG 21834]KLT15322.1 oxidoreductase [Neobacillus vireti]
MLKFATVGTSWITESFIKAAIASKQLQLIGGYSRTEEKAKRVANTYNAPYFWTDLEKMAKSTEFEAVYIASPNSVHFEQALTFLKNKKHVICEKPIFSNTAELAEAYQTAEENGVYLFEAIRNIHTPNCTILKEKLHLAGKLRSALLPYIQYSSRYDLFLQGEEPNIFSANYSGGALVDLGVYPLYLAVCLFGEPKKVTYHPVVLTSGVDGSGTLVLEYEEFVCTILCSKISHSELPCEIHGEAGTFVLEDAAPISSIKFLDSHTKESQILSVEQEEQDMVYECINIAKIIETKNVQEYERLKKWSKIVLRITEEARKQNDIIFASEK